MFEMNAVAETGNKAVSTDRIRDQHYSVNNGFRNKAFRSDNTQRVN